MRALRLEMESTAEHLLVATAAGLAAFEVILFFIQVTQHIRLGCCVVVALLGSFLIWDWKVIWERLRGALRQMVPGFSLARMLLLLIAIVASIEFLSAMAPLTGSDALQYHFAVPKQILELGFHPLFSNAHSFLCGQQHLLILFGLALGSEKLALGFIFLGGLLTAAALACLASRWASDWIAMVFAAIFLLTPVVFWQMTSSGSPDMYMGFFACAAVLTLGQADPGQARKHVLLAGFLAGAIAGAKYTGCFMAAALAVAVAFEFRNALCTLLYLAGSLVSGIWPYLRNLAWTGNPVFPYLAQRLSPGLVTTHALTMLYSDTGVSSSRHLAQIFPSLFFAAIQEQNVGLWDFFGPTVLVLAPLMLLAFKWEKVWRVLVCVWLVTDLGIFFSSGLPRYLLPIFPLALSCAAAGMEVAWRERWTIVTRVTGTLLMFLGIICAVGFAVYVKEPLRAAVGLSANVDYLMERGPDYQAARAVNEILGGRENGQRTLVFLRHLYYLHVSYVNGDPGTSFEVDPERMRGSQDWRAFFEKENIAFVVRSPDYPPAIAAPLEEMEKQSELIPIARAEIQNFKGKRVDETRVSAPLVILKVNR